MSEERDQPQYIPFERLSSLSSALVCSEHVCQLSRRSPIHLRSVVLLLSGAFTLATCIALQNTDMSGIYDDVTERKLSDHLNHNGYNDGNPSHGSPAFPQKLRVAIPPELWKRVTARFDVNDPTGGVEYFYQNVRNSLERPDSDTYLSEYSRFIGSIHAVAVAIRDCLLLGHVRTRYGAEPDYATSLHTVLTIISFLQDDPPILTRPPLSDADAAAVEELLNRHLSRNVVPDA